jgi:phenylacetate-coenzyme A ligase PaaK-like adenylate-forming protein
MEECEDGLLHQNTDFCRIDYKPLKNEFGGPELGRIFVTTFDNPWNVIIRFDIGDLVRLHKDASCACGRNSGMIADAIEGRIPNATFNTEGGLVSSKMLDDGLAECTQLRDYHLEQTDKTHYLLQAMLEPGADNRKVREELRSILEKVYGAKAAFDIAIMDRLLPGPAGKFRRTQANFDFEENKLFV